MTLLILACILERICAVVNRGNTGNSLRKTPELGTTIPVQKSACGKVCAPVTLATNSGWITSQPEVIPVQKSASGKLPLLGSHRRKAGIAENKPVPGTRLLVRKAVAALEYKSGDGRSFATPRSFRCREHSLQVFLYLHSKGLMSPEGLL